MPMPTVGSEVLVHFGPDVVDRARVLKRNKSGLYLSNVDCEPTTGTFGTWVRFDQIGDQTKAVWIEMTP